MTQRPVRQLAGIGIVAALLVAGLMALGIWQVERRAWKHALVAQVEARLHADPVAAYGPGRWNAVGPADAYTRMVAQGRWIAGRDTLVQASTRLGPGWWVISPLRDERGFTILINRGFVEQRAAPPLPDGDVTVRGLLRISEPGGGFLRHNDAPHDRWYSRDVGAIAAARRLNRTAPYFIDADAAATQPGGPVGGLTIVSFPDNHLVYALTWFGLALLVAGGYVLLLRETWRRDPRRDKTP